MPFFLDFLQSAKTSNLRALLTRSGNALLGNIFTFLCFNFDTKNTCKRPFNWPSLISARVMWICLSFRLNFCGRSAKTAILLIAGFRWTKNSRVSFRLILKIVYQKVSPGKIWRNPWSILIYSPLYGKRSMTKVSWVENHLSSLSDRCVRLRNHCARLENHYVRLQNHCMRN